MTIGLNTIIRTARLQSVLDALDFEADEYDSAHLLIYSGDRLPTGEAIDEYDEYGNDLLVDFSLNYPSGSITNNVLTFGVVDSVLGLIHGTAVWARLIDSNGDFVVDLSVSDTNGTGDVKIDSLEIFVGVAVNFVGGSITEGNA
jgi:hypothetical protein